MAQVYEPGHRCGVCWSRDGTSERHLIHSRVSSPAGQGRDLSLKESPVGTKISSLMSPASGSGLERGRVFWGEGRWRNCSLGQHQVLPSGVAWETST